MSNIVLGVLAHVDAGKTTLCEGLLYKTNTIKSLGRVDKKNSFLDHDAYERHRGITVFSKQAVFEYKGNTFYLQDTPGHVDFSSDMERTLKILDIAVVIISAPSGIQSHTKFVLELLEKRNIPTIVFVNKVDLPYENLDFPSNFVSFSKENAEDIALLSEEALLEYEKTESISDETIGKLVQNRQLIPVIYGSALKLEGLDKLLDILSKTAKSNIGSEFGAKCFRIQRDEKGNRLSFLKITGGSLKPRDCLGNEKITQLRKYNGNNYEAVKEAYAGSIVAVPGLFESYVGKGYGFEEDDLSSFVIPVLSYRVRPLATDDYECYLKLKILEEEDPNLKISFDEKIKEIHIMLLGPIQMDVLVKKVYERFGIEISIEEGNVVYRETIKATSLGIGHFEPLRHYAELHVLLEPLAYNTGIIVENACGEILDLNYQKQVLSILSSYEHKGILTGSLLTDVKITLIAGRSHLKHTEGGDMLNACIRAVRQALCKTENILLEPYYDFEIKLSANELGRALTDLKAMGCIIDDSKAINDQALVIGYGPSICLQTYQTTLLSYTRGNGQISLRYKGYYPCHNQDEVIEKYSYDKDKDMDNPCSSVFCSHGAGIIVRWELVDKFAHIENNIHIEDNEILCEKPKVKSGNLDFDERQLDEIIQREFPLGKKKQSINVSYGFLDGSEKKREIKKEYYIIDGYNLIFSLDFLKEYRNNINAAREILIDIIAEFKSMKDCEVVLVFDGYKLKGNLGSKDVVKGINIVYTKEAESADFYIEKLIDKFKGSYNIYVVTSDNLIQIAALTKGTKRVSSREFEMELKEMKGRVKEIIAGSRFSNIKLENIAKLN